ncbi:MAG: hypothetical protein WC100_20820 [Sterolibacterium sp.]
MPLPDDSLVAVLVLKLDDNLREDWEERASIMQFDGLLPKGHAECLAMIDLLCRHPAMLAGKAAAFGVTVHQFEIDGGGTEYLLSVDSNAARQYLVDVGGKGIAVVNLADVLHTQYSGVAMLTKVW